MNLRLLVLLSVVGLAACQFQRFRGRRPNNFRGRPNNFRPQPNFFRGPPQQQQQLVRGGGGGADGNFGGSEYHYSWRHDGGRKYSHSGAVNYCRGLGGGWGPVNIESPGEGSFVDGVISSNRQDYIWTGGVRNGRGWSWQNGSGFGFTNWSHTGGNQRSQPDNREGNESCLAILNNFYRDGIKWHDVGCSHTKPIICERG